MASKLKALVSFQGLVIGVPVALPHGLNWSGTAVKPDIAEVLGGAGIYTITADASNLTVTRLAGSSASVDILIESWHTVERAFDGVQNVRLSPNLLVVQGGGGGGGTGVDVESQGVAIPGNPHQTLNFTGSIQAIDAGGSVADIDLSSVFGLPGFTQLNLLGTNNDVDLWSGGPITSLVEVDISGNGNTVITGIDSSRLDPNKNFFLWLWSGGNGGVGGLPDTLTLVNQSASSLAANRIYVPNGKNLNLPNNDGVLLVWAGNSWLVWCGSDSMVRAQELSLDPSATPAALANATTYDNHDPFVGGPVTSNVKQDVAAGGHAIITGVVAAGAPNSEGRVLVFQNISASGSITFKNNNTGSVADNRLLLPGGLDLTIGPQGCLTLVYDDTVAMWRVQSSTARDDSVQMLNGEAFAVPIGTPVYCSAPLTFMTAKADAPNTAIVIGLVSDVSIAAGTVGNVQLDDKLTATTGQWDAVTGGAGGLQFGTRYFVSPTTAGQIMPTPPGTIGQFETEVGVGISPTDMVIRIDGPDPAVNVRLMFALWGQSNAFGQQGTANIINDQRLNIGVSYPNVNLRQKSSQPTAADPIVWTTNSTGGLSSYTSTQNNNSGHGIDGTGLGPAQSMGRHFDYFQTNKTDISCVGVSGSSLAVNWDPSGTYPAGGPNLYQQALAVTDAAMVTFGSTIGGFFWVQGETDATDAGQAAAYQANLTNLFNQIRVAYGPTLPIVFAQLSVHSAAPFAATVRAAQATVAGLFTNCTMVVTDDIPLGGDNTHYTADGYAALGDRMAAEMITLLGWAKPVPWTIDRFSLVGIPQTAVEWDAVLAAALIGTGGPARLYLLQEAAGNAVDTIGGVNMVPNGNPGLTYQASVPNGDWEAKSVAFTNGSTAAFVTTSASLPDPTTTSWTRLLYEWVPQVAGPQNMYIVGTAGFEAIANAAGGGGAQWQLSDGGNTVADTTSVFNFNVRPFVHLRSVTGLGSPRVDAYTTNAHISGVFGVVTGKSESIGCAFGGPAQQAIMCVEWDGTAADFVTNDIKTILQLLNWGNANLGAITIPW